MPLQIENIVSAAPVIPVLVIEQLEHAVPLARALCAGGLPVLEITLRTRVAADAIRAIRKACASAVVGAGTVTTPQQLAEAIAAGAQFLVSPGTTPSLLDAARVQSVPLLPGVATASEAMLLAEQGFSHMKFFPAEAAGGVAMLKSWAGPLPHLRFCPTGGIGPHNVASYLALPNVVCVGGSWLAPGELLVAGDWQQIEQLARQAAALGRR